MHAACLVAEYESHKAAKIGLEVLRKVDFHADAVSVAWKGHTRALGKLDRSGSGVKEVGVERSMEIGAGIGALVGTPLAIGSVMGPIMIAGPIAALVGGAALGAAMSEAGSFSKSNPESVDRVNSRGLFAMANHYGINAHSAAHFEKRINDGAILLIVTSTPPRLDEAQASLKTTGPVSLQRFEYRGAEESQR